MVVLLSLSLLSLLLGEEEEGSLSMSWFGGGALDLVLRDILGCEEWQYVCGLHFGSYFASARTGKGVPRYEKKRVAEL